MQKMPQQTIDLADDALAALARLLIDEDERRREAQREWAREWARWCGWEDETPGRELNQQK